VEGALEVDGTQMTRIRHIDLLVSSLGFPRLPGGVPTRPTAGLSLLDIVSSHEDINALHISQQLWACTPGSRQIPILFSLPKRTARDVLGIYRK
jgi:hypothetical protein